MGGAADGPALLARIGDRARPAGSAAEAAARAVCADVLAKAGFTVQERPFSYSAFPGLWGTPVAGFVLLIAAVVAAAGILRGGAAMTRGLGIGVVLVACVAVLGWWLGRHGTQRVPFLRRDGVNLEAQRGVPGVWLVAHLDSKSQPISLLVRAAASVGVGLIWVGLIICGVVSRLTPVSTELVLGLAVCGAVASVPLLVAWVGQRGGGALDNASGVATILRAATTLDLAVPLGVVVTSAEELGLAGARAWVEGRSAAIAINCDGVDDRGALTITATDAARRLLRSLNAAGATSLDATIRGSLPGVLMDSTAFADVGWCAFTVSRGNRASLARVHTNVDTLENLSGTGIERAASVIASLAGAIIAWKGSLDGRKGGI